MLAVLVALFAIPLLVLDSPAVAGGLETTSAPIESPNAVAPDAEAVVDENAVSLTEAIDAVADRTDGLAEATEAFVVENQLKEAGVAEGVDVDLSEILAQGFATFSVPDAETGDVEPAAIVAAAISEAAAAIEAEAVQAVEADDAEQVDEQSDEPAASQVEQAAEVEVEADAEATVIAEEPNPEPAVDEPVEPARSTDEDENENDGENEAPVEAPEAPATPPQVDGRVPPPADGPTAAQWDALRTCESTNNYSALNPSGKFRGAYQFSVETWDWVAGIHWPHLVGVDPATAEPAWQDIMAYTLFSMRGWDQWPECGLHLL